MRLEWLIVLKYHLLSLISLFVLFFFLSFNFSLNGMHSISFANRYWNLSFGITDRTICKLWRNANELVPDLKMFCMMSWWCVCVSLSGWWRRQRERHTLGERWWLICLHPQADGEKDRQDFLFLLFGLTLFFFFSPLFLSRHMSPAVCEQVPYSLHYFRFSHFVCEVSQWRNDIPGMFYYPEWIVNPVYHRWTPCSAIFLLALRCVDR